MLTVIKQRNFTSFAIRSFFSFFAFGVDSMTEAGVGMRVLAGVSVKEEAVIGGAACSLAMSSYIHMNEHTCRSLVTHFVRLCRRAVLTSIL
jgi:hypothetical protein